MSAYFFIVFILALLQRSVERSCIAMTFLVVTFCFDVISKITHEDFYYLVCAFGSWFSVVVLRDSSNHPLSVCLQILCFVSILLNFLGYIVWINYYPIALYNQSFIIVCACVIFAMLRGIWSEDDGKREGNNYNIDVGGASHTLRFFNY